MIRIVRFLAVAVLLLLSMPAWSTQAQDQAMRIGIEPQSAPPGTRVTIFGSGAPPGALVTILVSPFSAAIECDAGRGADVVAEVRADSRGRFSAVHQANRLTADQVGYTYLAKRMIQEVPQPQSNLECFRFAQSANAHFFTETGHTVSGRFLEYWNENGGLMVFGYPLTDARFEINSSGDYVLTQYFERQRFERHPENNRPYDVLLGRMGVEILEMRGINWQEIPRVGPASGCMYFEETGHNVCDQAAGTGFMSYWQSHGLDFGDPGFSFRESLALFGYPITEPFVTTNSSGDTVLTQWFERARFEWHPNNPDPYKVLLGRLGAEFLAARGDLPVTDQVNIYLIAEGQGNVGCGDAVVAVERQIEPTVAPLTAALRELLSVGGPELGQSGLYNALYRSNLHVESAEIVNGTAIIRLAGDFQIGGVCDAPRVEAQLTQTALQFSTVNAVEIYVNGTPLDQLLSGR